MSIQNHCENCQNEIQGNFCSYCGQKKGIGKITFKETFHDFVEMVFSVNAPLMKASKLLVTNPGKLFREYLSGKRKTYYKPVSFFIISTIVYLVIRSLINYNPMANANIGTVPKDFEVTLFMKAGQYMVTNINNIMFLFVFTLGLFFKFLFYKRNSLAEFIAISFYLVGAYTLIGTLIMFYLKYSGSGQNYIPVLVFLFYILYAFSSYFKSKSFLTILKIMVAYILSFIFYAMLGYGLSFLIVWLKSL
ncbi:MAG: DUF3667 domain-containing protein [Flavobacteriaceae bacterium]